ncbi:MAG TPA: pitrilysin family protein [Thermoanaerobaculia bacterium]|nr:pitrilysin family protein [Thermoanaerobaculia bacterium]
MKIFAIALTLVAQALAPLQAQPGASAPQVETSPPPPGPPPRLQLPKPFERTLKNGLRVIVVPKHDVPIVDVRLLIETGGEADPPNRAGNADMTASLLTKGTTTRSAEEIASDVEALGATLDSSAMWDASAVSLNVMSTNLPKALGSMADVVRNPVFKNGEIERLRSQNLDALEVAMHDPGELAGFVASRVLFGAASYGHNLGGTPASLKRITRTDIVSFHKRYYVPKNAILVFGGDVAPERAFELAQEQFGSWSGAPRTHPPPATRYPPAGRVVVIDMPDAGQAAVLVTRPGLRRVDPNYSVAQVTNSVLGGGYSSRLNEEIRIKRGLSYGAGSGFDLRRNIGPFVASAQTKNESAAEVASLIVGEMRKLANEPVADVEIGPRKATLIGDFGRSLETAEGLVGRVSFLALYGLPLDELNRYISGMQDVTAAEIRAFAASHFSGAPDVIIVGDAKKFLAPLRKDFKAVEVIPLSQLDLDSPTLRKPAR